MNSRAQRALDPILGTLGVLFGLPSLVYPFGRDQGLYYYVAREWVLRGSIPYRDVLDHKTPGIYYLHALSVLFFGEQMWGIRLFELACIVAIGALAGTLTALPGERVRPGVRGAAILAASILYYGYLDYWDTAQSEIWYGMLGLACVTAAVRIESDARAALIAGLLAGAAVVVKPPVIWILLVAVVLLVRRALAGGEKRASLVARARKAMPSLLRFGAGASLAPAATLAYFGAKGALPAMFDIVVGANAFYVKHEMGATMTDGMYAYHYWFLPLVPLLILYLLYALVRAWRAKEHDTLTRYCVAAAITAGAYAAVIMQAKYYLLHWGVAVPAWTLVIANVARTWADALDKRGRTWAFAPGVLVALVGLWSMAMVWGESPNMWRKGAGHAWRWTTRQESRDEFTGYFQSPDIGFWFTNSEHIGNWLRDHTTPEDSITVRGFQPEIYFVARRRHRGRFFWTTFLTNPARAYRREEWLQEDVDAIAAHPPKYVVALTDIPEGPDSVGYFAARGFQTTIVMNEYTIMEQRPAPPHGATGAPPAP